MTTPDEQTRSALTAKDHVEFEAAATTSPRRFLKEKHGVDPADYDTPSDFVAATAGKGDPSGPSHRNLDNMACEAMTSREKLEFASQSRFDNSAACLKDRNGVHPASFDDSSKYQKAVVERGEQ